MEKEYLEKLKEKIGNLSEEEIKERDKYLRDLVNGDAQGPLVGYQSIDRQWLKYYDLDRSSFYEKKTVYQGLYDNNKDHLDDLAIEYFLSKITFKQLLSNIEKTAQSFEANSVKKGDFVTICAPGIPETVYSFYALSKIGAIANMIAPYFDKNDFVDRVADCNSKLLVIMDDFYDEMKDAVKRSKIEKVIVVPTLNSSPLRFVTRKHKIDKDSQEFFWNDFIKEGNGRAESIAVDYEPSLPLTMVYSSGSTGASKGILLSNDSFQNSINSYFETGLDISRGQKFYQIIPTWFSTGISTSVHLPLSCGASVYMDPRFEREIFAKNIVKAKPNYSVAPTSMYEGLIDNPILKNKDLSYFNNAFEGGEPLSKELADRINKTFYEHGNSSSIKVGYGQCECGATITTQTENTEHCNGSVGIPLPGVNIQICDSQYNELPTGMRGQIIVDTKSSMLGYYENEKATEEYFFIDAVGKKWNCTGDIGYFDNDGNLFVEGRTSDYTIINDEIIYNFDVEKVIKNVNGIAMCDVLPKKSDEGIEQLAAHIIFDNKVNVSNIEEILRNIQEEVFQSTQNENMVPLIFKIRKDFPHAKSGKRDIGQIRSETEGFIYLDNQFEKEFHSK